MRIAYFDCFSGISGDMTLGALIDAGFPIEKLKEKIEKLNIKGYEIDVKKIMKGVISATKVDIKVDKKVENELKDIYRIIDESGLNEKVKKLSKEAFYKLAVAECKIHNKEIDKLHFHEIGGIDTIIDVVGSICGIEYFGVERVYSSPLPIGKGLIKGTFHGTLPNPAPATAEIIKNIPIYGRDTNAELVTPTGAIIISTITKEFGVMPSMRIEKIGYGAGAMDLEQPNLLRIFIGEKIEEYLEEEIEVIETNIDDMDTQFYPYVIDKLFSCGAIDVYLTPVYMKKFRPGNILTILVDKNNVDKVLNTLFTETTTIGVRITTTRRNKLQREIKEIDTKFGKVRVKISYLGKEISKVSPEYDDCQRIANEMRLPIVKVYEEIRDEFYRKYQTKN